MNKALTFLFLLSVFVTTFLPAKDTDFGWHYRCGEKFLREHAPCIKNELSYFLPEYQSFNTNFVYDAGIAFVYDRFGFLGLSVVGGMVMVLAAYLFLQLTNNAWYSFLSFYSIYFLSSLIFSSGLRGQILT
ncbi:hypothetical protein HYW87_03065, partial [Candidatus Roizmanbacteria bacterium]|nr:hypothetical protein [Candidatus Roizmanbacteria bacterium]